MLLLESPEPMAPIRIQQIIPSFFIPPFAAQKHPTFDATFFLQSWKLCCILRLSRANAPNQRQMKIRKIAFSDVPDN